MACYCILPEHYARGCTSRLCPLSVGEYRFVALTASYSTGIEPASVELAGLWHAMMSARALREGWHT